MTELEPIQCDKIWGYERWIASTHKDGCQKKFLEAVGGDYPLLIKVIQADTPLSVQVHPDDDFAARFEGGRGKTECWYVLSAVSGAKLVYGLNGTYTPAQIEGAARGGKLEPLLNFVDVRAGDFIYIPAGTVHAIGGGMRLMETQQSSNITYRLYDWNRGRELHVEKAAAVVKNDELLPVKQFPGSFDCKYFSMKEISVNGTYEYSAPAGEKRTPESWILLYVIEAEGASFAQGAKSVSMTAEKIYAVAPSERVNFFGKCRLMEIRAKSE